LPFAQQPCIEPFLSQINQVHDLLSSRKR
jgi:hypothetical protein